MRRKTILFAVIVALIGACTRNPGATPSPGTSDAASAPPATLPASPTAPPTARPTATPAPNADYTTEDEEIAKLIKAGAEEAIPQLRQLNDMDPSKLEDLFIPLDAWITSQKAGVDAYTPSSCTSAAVALFIEGMDRYDDIRQKFLAWRDWGANGHAFPVAAPGQAVVTLDEAVVELEAHCAG